MRIGFVSEALPYLPCREGFRIYGANLIRCLAPRHRIDLAALLSPGDRDHLDWPLPYTASITTIAAREHGHLARAASALSGYLSARPRHYRAELARFASRRDRDVMHVEGPFAGGLVAHASGPKLLSVHDSVTTRWREMARRARRSRQRLRALVMAVYARRYERLLYPRFDRCVVVTEREREALARVAPAARIEVVGNGTDTSYFRPEPGLRSNEPALVFHGNLGYPPNVAGAVELADRVFPRIREQVPAATLHLVGADPAPEVVRLSSRPGIRLAADVADIRPFLAGASVYACAIRHPGGIKNKLLEAMAMALPVVTYPQATSGIECVPDTHVLFAETPAELAERVVGLFQEPERGRALGLRSRCLMERRYSWESRAAMFERLYDEIIEASSAPTEARPNIARPPR
jgi:glycosyltransferase involved in cell wall biosynthesis